MLTKGSQKAYTNQVSASTVALGSLALLDDLDDKHQVMSGLLAKYFPNFTSGREYRPITGQELKRTSVCALAIDSCSGKRNLPEQALRSDEWPALGGDGPA